SKQANSRALRQSETWQIRSDWFCATASSCCGDETKERSGDWPRSRVPKAANSVCGCWHRRATNSGSKQVRTKENGSQSEKPSVATVCPRGTEASGSG